MEMSSEKTRRSISPHPKFMKSCIRAGLRRDAGVLGGGAKKKNATVALHPAVMKIQP